jgi:hypothetical protein
VASLTIPRRYNGPPDSANGGVSCGLLAQATGHNEVTLRRPPPLDRAMRVEDGSLYDGEDLVATSTTVKVPVDAPDPVSLAEATGATARYGGWQDHPFPTCFVCGPQHPDGLRVFPGPVREHVVAAPWVPPDDDPVMTWAALDCPSGWCMDLPGRPLVLGRMALTSLASPSPGAEHVVMGWLLELDGRKVRTGSALYSAAGDLLAVARQTWVAIAS